MDLLHLSGETKNYCESAGFQFPAASSFRDWTGLHPDLLAFTVTKLCRFSDWLRFCGVYPQWRSIGLLNDHGHKQSLDLLKSSRNKLPMLMIKTEENNNDRRGLYSVSEGITYSFLLPVSCRNRFIGSSYGWLLYEEGGVITLLNPLTNTSISLPLLPDSVCEEQWDKEDLDYFMVKGILTADPHASPNNYAVLITYTVMYKLVVYKSGDPHWKTMDLIQGEYQLHDVVYYKNELYGVNQACTLVQVDIDNGSAKTIIDGSNKIPFYLYLVESEGELLLLQRGYDAMKTKAHDYFAEGEITDNDDDDHESYYHEKTNDFKIFKVAHEKKSGRWVEIDNIGDQALFVGDNHSVSISALEFPGFRSNSIYFTNQYYQHCSPYICCGPDEDAGFFSLDDKSFHAHHMLDFCEWHMKPPIWFVPKFATTT